MLKKIQYSLVFNRKGKLNANGEGLVQIRAYQNGKSRYFKTGIYLNPKHWDERNKKVRYNHPNQLVYNKRIRDMQEEMETFEIAMINRYGWFPVDRLHEYQHSNQHTAPKSFTEFFTQELADHPMKPHSHKMYVQTLNKLNDFRRTVYFEDICYSFISDFDRYLFKQGLSINTVKKHHHRLKTFIRQAIKKGYLPADMNPYLSFKPKSAVPDRVYLTWEELTRIEEVQIPKDKNHLEYSRDIFLMACYTGLRYSDVTRISRAHLVETTKGFRLEMKIKKTEKPAVLPLHTLFPNAPGKPTRPEKIALKYLNQMPDSAPFDSVPLFDLSLQYLNRALKEIARLARIRKKVTTHVARRTFATILATKVESPVLQKLLQHSSPDMTMIYIQLSNDTIERELEQVKWNL